MTRSGIETWELDFFEAGKKPNFLFCKSKCVILSVMNGYPMTIDLFVGRTFKAQFRSTSFGIE